MAPTARTRTSPRETRRQVIQVPLNVSHLLTLMANYQVRTKAALAEDIWLAGLCAYLGVSREDLEELVAAPLPRGSMVPQTPRELTKALLGA